MVDPEPAPPHVVRQQLNELQRIHAIAQQALSNIIVATSTLHDMDDGYALPDVEPTPENKSLLSPAGAEPLYAVVTKKKTKLPKISVTFENQTEILSTPTPSPEVHHGKYNSPSQTFHENKCALPLLCILHQQKHLEQNF